MIHQMKEYYVYILKCRDKSYSVGVTNNLEERLLCHEHGEDPGAYTYTRRPFTLVYAESFREVTDAIAAEKQIKGWSRKKKEALIHDNFDQIEKLSKRHSKLFRC